MLISRADRATRPQWVAVADGRIVRTGVGTPPEPDDGIAVIDAGDDVLVPGFVDLQVNGIGPDDCATADPSVLARIGRRLGAAGVTAWCPTLVTAPSDHYDAFLAAVASASADASANALPVILGAHLEGPFLGGAPGAHDPSLVRPADVAWLDALLDAHPGVVRIVTLAPEADPDLAATRLLRARGVTVAIGHTTTSEAAARAAADAGASVVTHLFNAMSPLQHRDPGVVGAALADDRFTPTVVADLVHVHATPLRIAFAAKERVAVVSDVVSTAPPLVDRDGAAYLTDGTLAGATSLLDQALRNLLTIGVPFARAVDCLTTVPASLVGAPDHGSLRVGARADVVALNGAAEVTSVWIAGEPVI